MEDIKWLFKKCGILILMLLMLLIAGISYFGKLHTKDEKVVEVVWEPDMEIENRETIPTEAEHPEIFTESETSTESEASTESDPSTESAYWFIPQAGDCLLSDTEQEELQREALLAAETVSGIYKDAKIVDAPNYSSGVKDFTGIQRKAVVEELGQNGLVSVEEDTNMQNYEAIENFYSEYQKGQDSMVTVFEVYRDGLLSAVTFIYREDKLQTFYVGVRWKEGGVPQIQGTSSSTVSKIKLTPKGYFIYEYEEGVAHESSREYWRVKPLSDKCRELTRKYIYGLSYMDYNMLVVNWDSSNAEDILMPNMFEDIYRIDTGEKLEVENWQIPAKQYEEIMTTYFPVSVEQVREHCGYDSNSDSYPYEIVSASPFPPFGEVVDYTDNANGTITLIVDAVWADFDSDCAFTNKIVVQPFEDGTFRYLSNSIEQKELEIPKIK